MSPFCKPVILDNNCIVNFYFAESLKSILTLWPPGTFKIPERVLAEASNWHEHGKEVCQIIKELTDARIVEIIIINDHSDEEVSAYIQLKLAPPVLGSGEAESIAIASTRNYIIATDDLVATERCKIMFPSIEVITTADIFKMAKSDDLLKESQVDRIWKLIRKKRTKV